MMKKNFLAGIAILLPIAITVWIVDFFFNLLTGPFLFAAKLVISDFGFIPDDHPFWIFISRIAILLILVVVTFILGFFAQKFFFGYLISKVRRLMKRIPIIKTIYQVAEQTIDSFLNEKKNPFSEVVSFSFPNSEVKCLSFLTGKSAKQITDKHPELTEVVFVPTAPHPISGFLLFAPKNAIAKVDIDPEDAFKILFSCGTFDPKDKV